MFWGKKSAKEEGKLLMPRPIPGLVQKHLVAGRKMDPDLVQLLKAVVCKSASREARKRWFVHRSRGGKKLPLCFSMFYIPFTG